MTSTSRLIMQKARRQSCDLRLLVSTRFQVLFTPLNGVLFAFPSRYWFTIGQKRVFSLTGWSPWIQAGFLVPRLTQVPASSLDQFRLRACHALWGPFPRALTIYWIGNSTCCRPYNPRATEMERVWAYPISLATTLGIEVSFFSWGY